MIFPDEIKEVITGMILSDGNLQITGNNARLRIDQKDYGFVLHLWSLFYSIGMVGAPAGGGHRYAAAAIGTAAAIVPRPLWRCGGALSSSALRPSNPVGSGRASNPVGSGHSGHTTLAELAVVRRRAAPPLSRESESNLFTPPYYIRIMIYLILYIEILPALRHRVRKESKGV